MEKEKVFLRTASGLVRVLSPWDSMLINAMFAMLFGCFILGPWTAALYPGVYIPWAPIIIFFPSLVVAYQYIYMATAMPRTGGDYIWGGRIIHPVAGFMSNLYFTNVMLTWTAVVPSWGVAYGVGALFIGLGVLNNNPNLIGTGQWLGSGWPLFIFTGILNTVFISFHMISTKLTSRTNWAFYIANTIATAVFLVVAFTTGPHVFAQNLEKISGISYQAVINAAKSQGFFLGFSWMGMFLGVVYAFQNTLGYTCAVYYAGEIKAPKMMRGMTIAIAGSLAVFTIYSIVLYYGFYAQVGQEFYHAISNLYVVGSSAYPFPTFPSATFYVIYSMPNPIILAIVSIGFLTGCIAQGLTKSFVASRNFFAWSFDRVIPTRFADVSRTRGTPYASIILAIIVVWILNAINCFTSVFAMLIYTMLGWALGEIIVGFSGLIFPWRRKDIFEAAPDVVKRKIGRMPVVSLFGLGSMAFHIFMAAAIMLPSVSGAMSPVPLIATLCILFPFPAAVYYVSRTYWKRKGVPIDLAHRELPPE